MEGRVLAVDGGQSAIRIAHSLAGVPAQVDGVSRQEGDVVGAVIDAVIRGWRTLGSPDTERVVLGLTTAPAAPADQARLTRAVGDAVRADEVWLCDDAVTTHAGALSMGWGVSVIAGTGVACLAMPADPAVPARILGGHGFLLGDEGGGYWIGREGIRAVLRAADGRGPGTALTAPISERFDGPDDLSARIHALPRPVNAIAQAAPDVLAAAAAGDEVADRVVAAAVQELTELIGAGAAVAGQGADGAPVPVAVGGRLLGEASLLRRRLDRAVATTLPGVTTRDADGTPLHGALALGAAPDPGRYAPFVTTWRRDG